MLKKRNGPLALRRLVYAHSTRLIEPERLMCSGVLHRQGNKPIERFTFYMNSRRLQIESVYGHKVRVHEPV
jgi:hypothetical protein